VDKEDPPDPELRILSWNIDGLDDRSDDISGRTLWVVHEINRLRPHVVFFQELIESNMSLIEKKCTSSFHIFRQSRPSQPYFVAILVHKASMILLSSHSTVVPFPSSRMGRSGVFVSAQVRDHSERIGFLTGHLESLREGSAERMNQFNICEQFIAQQKHIVDFCVFGGDLNARDNEIPKNLEDCDAWSLAGRPGDHQFTWDMVCNQNLSAMSNGGKPRCRFDRVYIVPQRQVKVFQLVGTDPVPGLAAGRFASDHFGLFVSVSLR